MPLTVIHGEADIGYGGSTIILRHRPPCVAKRIDAIPVIACNAHALAYLLNAGVGTAPEAVGGAETVMEGKQVLIIIGRGVLLEYRQESLTLNFSNHLSQKQEILSFSKRSFVRN